MHAPPDWTIGRHTFRWEHPNILWARLDGDNTLEEATQMVDLYKQLGEVRPFFLVTDMKVAGVMKPETRHYLSERIQHEWLVEAIFFNTRLLHRAAAQGLLLAAEMFRLRESPMRGRIHFVSSQAKAEALLAQLRERRGEVARVA